MQRSNTLYANMSGQVASPPGSHPDSMPIRQFSASSAVTDDGAVPSENPKDTSELLAERLRAYKHAVAYLEDYIGAVEKAQKAQSKEYEKVLKTIANPLREGHHFQQELGGMAGFYENMRTNTQGLINSHLETESNLKGQVLPILDRLHKEIKHKSKELLSGAVKGAKEVEKARNTTQKHIELLGSQSANYQSSGASMKSHEDPYVVHRGVLHRLHKQVLEENNNRHDLISVQNNFAQFEAHIIEIMQQTMMTFNQFLSAQSQREISLWEDMLGTCQAMPKNLEWEGFVHRNQALLVDPNAPDRSVDTITFANQNHESTQALIEGSLERKSRNKLSFSGYTTGYYVVTPSKFLHEFKDNDNIRKDPVPELSIYLPDATIGSTNGEKFNVKGKDVSKGIGSKLSGTSEIAFKAHSAADATKWYEVIRGAAGNGPTEGYSSGPTSPVGGGSQSSGTVMSPINTQTSGNVTGGETVTSPSSVVSPEAQKINAADFAPMEKKE